MNQAGRAARLGAAVLAGMLVLLATAVDAKTRATLTLAQADTTAAMPPDRSRTKALEEWARSAPLEQIMYVLRRAHEELRDNEAVLVEAALRRAPTDRKELRGRLVARLIAADPKRAGQLGSAAPPISTFPAASTFRVALLAPSEGDFVDDGQTMIDGFRAGFGTPGAVTIEVVNDGRDGAVEAADAFDRAARRCGLICGGLAPGSAMMIASASRWSGIPALLPSATDPGVTSLSPHVWEIGPSGEMRGRVLARAVLKQGRERIAILTSSAADTSFASGFAAACRIQGSEVITRQTYAPGNATFTYEIRSLFANKITLLFWDGEPNEAAALLRQLTRERVSLRFCGGDGLAPDRHHRETKILLEGVMYVDGDWSLDSTSQTRLGGVVTPAAMTDGAKPAGTPPGGNAWATPPSAKPPGAKQAGASGAAITGKETVAATATGTDPMFVRGYLAGRAAAAALASRPLAPEELTRSFEQLATKSGASAASGANTTIGVSAASGAGRMLPIDGELHVYTIAKGQAERASP